ncbi:MAG TPA: hypothetical protein PKM59_01370 [Thermodesulfobacteriota bacterium]|nr:hypothetical protein [Thermodesulfobacteriota bacterium]
MRKLLLILGVVCILFGAIGSGQAGMVYELDGTISVPGMPLTFPSNAGGIGATAGVAYEGIIVLTFEDGFTPTADGTFTAADIADMEAWSVDGTNKLCYDWLPSPQAPAFWDVSGTFGADPTQIATAYFTTSNPGSTNTFSAATGLVVMNPFGTAITDATWTTTASPVPLPASVLLLGTGLLPLLRLRKKS